MGDTFAAIHNVSELAMLAALASVRFAMAFLLLPVLSQDTVPQLVRGAVFLAFGVVTLSVSHWIGLFAKEAFLGLALGMLLAAVLWAFAAAGEIVDGASGLSQAQVTDPLSGRQTSLSGAFLGRLAVYVFMFSGGMMLWIGVLMESFLLWPLAQPGLAVQRGGVALFESAFAQFAGLSFMLAAPALVVLYAIDLSLGLMNRFAPQLNLYSLSTSLKSVAAVMVWLAMLSTLVKTLLNQLAALLPTLLQKLQALGG
jgi:type III secretion protein SpaR/YscT/HrcT